MARVRLEPEGFELMVTPLTTRPRRPIPFFLREFHFLRTGHRGQPILATNLTTAEPTAVDPGTARAKRMVMAGAYATAGTARAKRVVMAVPHAMVAARTGWQSAPPQEGGAQNRAGSSRSCAPLRGSYKRAAQRGIAGTCRLRCAAHVRHSRGRRRGWRAGRTPTAHAGRATWRRGTATG